MPMRTIKLLQLVTPKSPHNYERNYFLLYSINRFTIICFTVWLGIFDKRCGSPFLWLRIIKQMHIYEIRILHKLKILIQIYAMSIVIYFVLTTEVVSCSFKKILREFLWYYKCIHFVYLYCLTKKVSV